MAVRLLKAGRLVFRFGVSNGDHNDWPTPQNFAVGCGFHRYAIITWVIENTTTSLAALHQK
jgi:hypothetical protein